MATPFKKILLLLIPIVALLTLACEKDDICDPATPVTSQLVIRFFNQLDNQPRNVTNLAVVGIDVTDADTLRFNGVNEIRIPLDITADAVEYRFILNNGNNNPDIIYTDDIIFNYTRSTEYVSRACGYRTLFQLNNDIDLPPPFLLNGTYPIVAGSWIKNIIVENYNINSENETHIEIYF